MKNLELQKCILGSVYTNCYFLKNKTTGELLVIDPADAPERIGSKVNEMQATPVAILLTHGHFDHIIAADAVRKKYGISVYACSEEVETLQNAGVNLSQYHGASVTLKPDVLLADLQVVDLAGFSIEVFHTPGHTAGSCCYYLQEEEVLFSGDTLFAQSVGRTDFPTGSGADMQASVKRLLKELPETTRVCPGHNEETTIGYEKRYNPFA